MHQSLYKHEVLTHGVIHANVGQKLLICYPFKSFLGDQ
jgi:hypothetical protein